MTTVWTITPTRNSQRMFGPNTITRRGHRNVSPRPTPSATRIIAGPMMCAACGASGSLRIGIGGSLPARPTPSVPVSSSVTAPGPRSPGCRSLSVTSISLPCSVLRREHLDRRLGGVRVGRDAALEEVLRGLLDLDVPGERGHDRLLDALALVLLDHLRDDLGEGHRRGDDRVPVAQHERVDPLVLEAPPDGIGVGLGGLAAGDVDPGAGRTE